MYLPLQFTFLEQPKAVTVGGVPLIYTLLEQPLSERPTSENGQALPSTYSQSHGIHTLADPPASPASIASGHTGSGTNKSPT